ncbi:MAG TPA: hypothetical protein VGE50_00155 [Gammaproteobacteria bacterium]
MLKPMLKKLFALLLCVMSMTLWASEVPLRITADEWAQPRSGESLLRHPALSEAVRLLQARESALLEIRYPGGDSGSLWARELQAWLVALGIESSRIRLLPGSEALDQLQLRIR